MATRRAKVPAPTRKTARVFRRASREKRPYHGRKTGGSRPGTFFRSERTVNAIHAVTSNASRMGAVTGRETRRFLPSGDDLSDRDRSNNNPSKHGLSHYDTWPCCVVYRSYLLAASFTPTSSNNPSATSIISSSTVRLRAMASFSGMETILFARNAAMQPNSLRCTMSMAPRP